MKGMCVCCEER